MNVVPLALLCGAQPLALPELLAATIELGGDADTIASIAGQVSGGAVPQALVEQIDNRTELVDIVQRFADFASGMLEKEH